MVSRVIPVEAFDLVIFGGTGDLARRKIFPGLYRRFLSGQMPPEARVIGAARSEMTDDGFRATVGGAIAEFVGEAHRDAASVADFLSRVGYVAIDAKGTGGWDALKRRMRPGVVQAVYFSGKNMPLEFNYIEQTQGKLSMAREKRRPDYRSSGVKRLMPQLLTKVPTLRRWGKKMAVVVDAPFFHSMGKMERVSDVSNADIVWFLVDFVENSNRGRFRLEVVEEFYTTLESATLGLTGGVPVSQGVFEGRIKAKAKAKT